MIDLSGSLNGTWEGGVGSPFILIGIGPGGEEVFQVQQGIHHGVVGVFQAGPAVMTVGDQEAVHPQLSGDGTVMSGISHQQDPRGRDGAGAHEFPGQFQFAGSVVVVEPPDRAEVFPDLVFLDGFEQVALPAGGKDGLAEAQAGRVGQHLPGASHQGAV